MKITCSVCGKDMGEKEPFDNDAITHSHCPPCTEVKIEEARKFNQKYKEWRERKNKWNGCSSSGLEVSAACWSASTSMS